MTHWLRRLIMAGAADMAAQLRAELRAEAFRLSPPTRPYRRRRDRGPIRVQATVGDPLREIEAS